jgi:hypothetical protein
MDPGRFCRQTGLAVAAWCALPLVAVLLAGGCSNDPTGVYQGTYADGSQETIVIRPDGTFEQTLTLDSRIVYENRGTWGLKGDYIKFYAFIRRFDLPSEVGGGTDFLDVGTGAWGGLYGELVFSEYDNYRLTLVSKSTPPPEPMDMEEVLRYRQKFRHPFR